MIEEISIHWFRQDLRLSDNPSLNFLSENQNDEGVKTNPIENVFYNYLKELIFEEKNEKKLDNKEKKIRKKLDQNFKKNLDILKESLKNQKKFNQTIAQIISNMSIDDKEILEDSSEKKKDEDQLNNTEQEDSQGKLQTEKDSNEFEYKQGEK